jgi:hypothetical protein
MIEPIAVKRIAVVGAGTIGASWVAWFLARGMQVTVWDPRAEAADYVPRYVAEAWPAMARLGMTADASPDAWRFCATPEEAVADAEFVQENAPERMATKRELYTRLDPVMPGDGRLGWDCRHPAPSQWNRDGLPESLRIGAIFCSDRDRCGSVRHASRPM